MTYRRAHGSWGSPFPIVTTAHSFNLFAHCSRRMIVERPKRRWSRVNIGGKQYASSPVAHGRRVGPGPSRGAGAVGQRAEADRAEEPVRLAERGEEGGGLRLARHER